MKNSPIWTRTLKLRTVIEINRQHLHKKRKKISNNSLGAIVKLGPFRSVKNVALEAKAWVISDVSPEIRVDLTVSFHDESDDLVFGYCSNRLSVEDDSNVESALSDPFWLGSRKFRARCN